MTRKVIDIDKIFDDFLVSYINENRGKFSEDEWESKIVNLYNIFLETRCGKRKIHLRTALQEL